MGRLQIVFSFFFINSLIGIQFFYSILSDIIMSKIGQLKVYYGCMFSGKTSALIEYLSHSGLKPNEFIVIKPDIDIRYSKNSIVTHDGKSHECLIYHSEFDVFEHVTAYTKLLIIDEAQFINKVFISDVKRLLAKGIDVVAAGLDTDYLIRPFGLMAGLVEIANEKNQLKAKCATCGGDAEFTYRKTENKVLILVGQSEHYEARCSNCHPLVNKASVV